MICEQTMVEKTLEKNTTCDIAYSVSVCIGVSLEFGAQEYLGIVR